MRPRIWWYVFFIFLIAATAIGIWALVVRFSEGLIVSNLSNIVPWGLWVSLYIFFIGLSAGSFLISTLVYVFDIKKFEHIGRMAVFQAFICLCIGLFLVLLDLGHPERFYQVFLTPGPHSVLAYEIYFYILYILILIAELYFLMRKDFATLSFERSGGMGIFYRCCSLGYKDKSSKSLAMDMKIVKILAMIGLPVAIIVHGGTGAIFSVVKVRPYWYTALFPVVFIVSALVSGGGLLAFITGFFSRLKDIEKKTIVKSLARLTAGILCFDLMLMGIEVLVGLYGQIPEHIVTYNLIMKGPFWWVFWFIQLFIGAVIPLSLIFNKWTGNSLKWLGVSGALIVIGIVGVRLNIIIPPLTNPLLPGLTEAYHSLRNIAYYFPSLNEWLTSMGVIALGVWGFLFGYKLLPLEGYKEISSVQ